MCGGGGFIIKSAVELKSGCDAPSRKWSKKWQKRTDV